MRKLAILAALATIGCGTYIEPGHVGVRIHTTGGGVDPKPVPAGWEFYAPIGTDIISYPTFMQTLVLTATEGEGAEEGDQINVNTIEGQPVSMDVALSFDLDPAKVPALYTTFRTDIEHVAMGYMRQTIRAAVQEAAGRMPVADIIGPKKDDLRATAAARIAKELSQYGINVRQFTINEIRPPTSVTDAINAKNVMQQQALTAQNQLAEQSFKAQSDSIRAAGEAKAIRARAEAQADANRRLAESITPTLVEYERVKKWNGQLPQFSGSAPVPFLNVKP